MNDSLENIQIGRDQIQEQIQELANQRTADLGIAILDFRFKRINYAEEVRRTVYDRMISERNRIADKFRSEGQGEASRINGEKESMEAYGNTIDKETTLIISTDSEFYRYLNSID